MSINSGRASTDTERTVLAVDVGGTDMKAALADGAGLSDVRRMPTPRDVDAPGEAIVRRILSVIEDYRRTDPARSPAAIGLTVPGLVDELNGVGVYSANLGWNNFPFVQRLQEATGLPVAFGHDVGAAGEAEMQFGAGQSLQDAVVMIIGTGIAGVSFSAGRRIIGKGFAGELGHAQVPHGEPCPCGAQGCLETIGSAGAIARRYTTHTGDPVRGAREVLEKSLHGDAAAQQVWAEAVAALAFTIRQLTSILSPEAVIIGGGLAQAEAHLLDPLRAAVDQDLSFHYRPAILTAELGENAGLIGASLRARDSRSATT